MTNAERSEIIEAAWDDQISFDAIRFTLGVTEAEVIAVMRASLKRGSFKAWRERVSGRRAKHTKLKKNRNVSTWRPD